MPKLQNAELSERGEYPRKSIFRKHFVFAGLILYAVHSFLIAAIYLGRQVFECPSDLSLRRRRRNTVYMQFCSEKPYVYRKQVLLEGTGLLVHAISLPSDLRNDALP